MWLLPFRGQLRERSEPGKLVLEPFFGHQPLRADRLVCGRCQPDRSTNRIVNRLSWWSAVGNAVSDENESALQPVRRASVNARSREMQGVGHETEVGPVPRVQSSIKREYGCPTAPDSGPSSLDSGHWTLDPWLRRRIRLRHRHAIARDGWKDVRDQRRRANCCDSADRHCRTGADE